MLLTDLPGVYPREVIEAALPLEYPEDFEVGLLVSLCPGIPTDGRAYKPHRLRVKVLSPDLVDVCCPHGCDPKEIWKAIMDLPGTDKLATE